jgi:hypothetical protein
MTAKVADPAALARLAELIAPALARQTKKRTAGPNKPTVPEVRDVAARPPQAA